MPIRCHELTAFNQFCRSKVDCIGPSQGKIVIPTEPAGFLRNKKIRGNQGNHAARHQESIKQFLYRIRDNALDVLAFRDSNC
ncbi:MAG: hypothetical protein RLZZ501_1724 [Pseudomonadota bacterium]